MLLAGLVSTSRSSPSRSALWLARPDGARHHPALKMTSGGERTQRKFSFYDVLTARPLQPDYPHVGHDPQHDGPPGELTPLPEKRPTRVPPYGTREQKEHFGTPFHPELPMPPPRTIWEQYRRIFFNWKGDPELPTLSRKEHKPPQSLWRMILGPMYPLKPDTYQDPYLRPNPCPEDFTQMNWRWPHARDVNPKIPPPVDGKYNDFYHYFAHKQWLRKERDVYMGHMQLVHEMTLRCTIKEGPINATKNCRHLANKHFAMSRMEEFNQTLLYMAVTGNGAIRETPYPTDFVEQKRKIYDDWLFRTRLRKPGDPF